MTNPLDTSTLRTAAVKALAVLDEIKDAGFADDMDANGIPVTQTIADLRAALLPESLRLLSGGVRTCTGCGQPLDARHEC